MTFFTLYFLFYRLQVTAEGKIAPQPLVHGVFVFIRTPYEKNKKTEPEARRPIPNSCSGGSTTAAAGSVGLRWTLLTTKMRVQVQGTRGKKGSRGRGKGWRRMSMATSSRERMYRGAAGFADGSVGKSRTSIQRKDNTEKGRPAAVARETEGEERKTRG